MISASGYGEIFTHSVTFKKQSTKQYIQCAILKKRKENKTTSKSIFLIFFPKKNAVRINHDTYWSKAEAEKEKDL